MVPGASIFGRRSWTLRDKWVFRYRTNRGSGNTMRLPGHTIYDTRPLAHVREATNRQVKSRVKGFGTRDGGSVAVRTRGAGFYQPTGEAICQRGSVHVKPGRVGEATVRATWYKACGMQDPCHTIVYHNIMGRDPKRARHIGGNCPAPIWRGTQPTNSPASQMTFAHRYASLFRGPATRSTTPIRFASRRTQQLTRVPVGGTLVSAGDDFAGSSDC